jgi:hypothetical protein
MPVPRIPGYTRLTKVHAFSAAGLAAVGAAALVFAAVPGSADSETGTQALSGAAKPATWNAEAFGTQAQKDVLTQQADDAAKKAEAAAKAQQKAAAEAKQKAEAAAKQKAAAQAMAKAKAEYAAEQKKKAEAAAKAKADQERAAKETASRAAARQAATPTYTDNLDGWIKHALAIMKEHGIPGTYEGLHRNIIRESGGDPRAINHWDINAQNGVPSKGLLQVIKPTFDAYHVEGTSWDQYDPVANLVAAANYAADRYGSIDNVNSAY